MFLIDFVLLNLLNLWKTKEKNKKMNAIKAFFNSVWATVLVAVITVVGWQFNLVYISVPTLAVFCFLSLVLCDDIKPALIPVIFVPYMLRGFQGTTIWWIYGCSIALFLIGMGIFLIRKLVLQKTPVKLGRMFWFIVVADIAFLLGGVIGHFDITAFAVTFALCVAILFMYWMSVNFMGDARSFLAKTFLFLSLIIICEMWCSYISIGDLQLAFSNKLVRVGLDEINTAAIFLCVGMMACLYLGLKHKFDYLFGLLTLFIFANLVLTFSRIALLVGAIVLFAGGLYFIIKSTNKKILLSIGAVIVAIGLVATGVFYEKISQTLSWYIQQGFSGNGRDDLWAWCWNAFLQNPIFGAGYLTQETVTVSGFFQITGTTNIIYAHNTVLQCLTCLGVVGLLLNIPMYVQKYRIIFNKFSVYKFFTLLQLAAIGLTGMLDSSACTHPILLIIIWIMVASCEGETAEQRVRFGRVDAEEEDRRMYIAFKRFADIVVSLMAIIILSPVLLLLCLIVACFIGRPVFFKQPRPGKNGKLFYLVKFRSMTNKKDENGNLLPDGQRITKLGKFLRASSLDELPQLFNILKGDMSLIGPRPRLVADMVFYDEDVRSLDIKPGLTGNSQVNGRNLNTWEQTFLLDKEYVEKVSFGMDTKIFFKTFLVLLNRKGTSSSSEMPRDYRYGDYLLRVKKISQEEYDEGQKKAALLIDEFKNKKRTKKNVQK